MKFILIGTLAAILAAGTQSNEAERQLKAAMNAELVNGDLKTAIKQYGEIAAKYKDDRAVVAMALMRMAECYQKMGNAEANRIYERVVREFADQKEAATVARARLAAPQASAGIVNRKLFESSNLSFQYQAISPDGRYIAYPRIQPGPRGLMLRDLVSGTDRQLTDYGMSKLATTSIFSPDSRMIAFRVDKRPNGQDLRIIGIDGTGERVIFENENVTASHPQDWSPDGKSILVVFSMADRSRQIAVVSVSDGSVRGIKTTDWRLGAPDRALFSLDGRQIVYHQLQQEGSSSSDIFLLSLDGSREVRLVQHPADDTVVGWAPDGRLLFTSDRSGTRDLYALRVSGAGAVGDPELLQRNVLGLDYKLTRTGALHYVNFHKANGAYITGLDVQNGTLTTPPMPVTEIARDYNWTPAFSPDGSQVAVISFRGKDKISVIVKSLTNNSQREIPVPEMRVAYDLLWHPDERSLFIRGNDSHLRWGIHRLDLATGRLGEPILSVPSENNLGQFELSPDGTVLYYEFRDASGKTSTLKSRNLRNGEERDLYSKPLGRNSNISFALAPGGKRIAMVTDLDWTKLDAATWMILDLEQGTSRTVPSINRGTFAPVWTPDERYLVFASNQSWWRVSVEDGNITELGPTNVEGMRGQKRMHPDGTRLAFFTVKEISEFWVMENLFPKQVGRR
ncbi:MAG TPA: hypothetical protein VMZ52_16080 [Bryobacteraceae bacterium]|nr:hypothetical protein [Bryobacteraceae bacterium]